MKKLDLIEKAINEYNSTSEKSCLPGKFASPVLVLKRPSSSYSNHAGSCSVDIVSSIVMYI